MNCVNCGTEVNGGQKFCRQCGTPVAEGEQDFLQGEIVGTRVMNSPDSSQLNAETDSFPKGEQYPASSTQRNSQVRVTSDPIPTTNQTVDFRGSKSTNPTGQSAPPSIYNTAPPDIMPPSHFNTKSLERKQQLPSKKLLIVAGGVLLLFMVVMAIFLTRFSNSSKRVVSIPVKPSMPEIPTSAESYLPEDTAVSNDEETIVTAKFPLIGSAKFSLNNLSGNVTIDGTDDMNATIKVIKKGGTIAERKDVKVGFSTIGSNLMLKSPQIIPQNIDLSYEIKLPRSLGQARIEVVSSKVKITDIDALVDVKSVSGAIELSKIKGAVTADTQSGDITLSQATGDINITSTSGKIELNDVSGATIKTNNIQGDTRAVINSTATSADALTFESVSGDIDVKFKSEINAELDAGTVSGSIDVEGLGVQVKKSPGSATATGRVGIGGQPLKIKTTSGNIKVTKKY